MEDNSAIVKVKYLDNGDYLFKSKTYKPGEVIETMTLQEFKEISPILKLEIVREKPIEKSGK